MAARRHGPSFDEDFVLLAEFSEAEGPIPLKVIPTGAERSFPKDAFVLRVMSVDYEKRDTTVGPIEDTSLVISEEAENACAYVHHFALYDICARGFVRRFAMCFISADRNKIMSNFEDLKLEFGEVSSYMKTANLDVFLPSVDVEERKLKAARKQLKRLEAAVKESVDENGKARNGAIGSPPSQGMLSELDVDSSRLAIAIQTRISEYHKRYTRTLSVQLIDEILNEFADIREAMQRNDLSTPVHGRTVAGAARRRMRRAQLQASPAFGNRSDGARKNLSDDRSSDADVSSVSETIAATAFSGERRDRSGSVSATTGLEDCETKDVALSLLQRLVTMEAFGHAVHMLSSIQTYFKRPAVILSGEKECRVEQDLFGSILRFGLCDVVNVFPPSAIDLSCGSSAIAPHVAVPPVESHASAERSFGHGSWGSQSSRGSNAIQSAVRDSISLPTSTTGTSATLISAVAPYASPATQRPGLGSGGLGGGSSAPVTQIGSSRSVFVIPPESSSSLLDVIPPGPRSHARNPVPVHSGPPVEQGSELGQGKAVAATVPALETPAARPSDPKMYKRTYPPSGHRAADSHVKTLFSSFAGYSHSHSLIGKGWNVLRRLPDHGLKSLLFSVLCGRRVIVHGPENRRADASKILAVLSLFVPSVEGQSGVLKWLTSKLTFSHIVAFPLIGASTDIVIPARFLKFMSVVNLEQTEGISVCSIEYKKGKLIDDLMRVGEILSVRPSPDRGQPRPLRDCDIENILVAHIQSVLADIGSRVFLYFRQFCVVSDPRDLDIDNENAGNLAAAASDSRHARSGLSGDDFRIVQHLTEVLKLQLMRRVELKRDNSALFTPWLQFHEADCITIVAPKSKAVRPVRSEGSVADGRKQPHFPADVQEVRMRQ